LASGPPSAKFSLAQTSSYATAPRPGYQPISYLIRDRFENEGFGKRDGEEHESDTDIVVDLLLRFISVLKDATSRATDLAIHEYQNWLW